MAPTPESPTSRRPRFSLGGLQLRHGAPSAEVRASFFTVARSILETVGQLANLRLAHPEVYGPTDLFLLDEQDAQAIAGPLANMVARRTPSGLGSNSDAADLIGLTIGTGGYAIKNLQRRAQIHRLYELGQWSPLEAQNPTGPAAAPEPAGSAVPPNFPPPPPGAPYVG